MPSGECETQRPIHPQNSDFFCWSRVIMQPVAKFVWGGKVAAPAITVGAVLNSIFLLPPNSSVGFFRQENKKKWGGEGEKTTGQKN